MPKGTWEAAAAKPKGHSRPNVEKVSMTATEKRNPKNEQNHVLVNPGPTRCGSQVAPGSAGQTGGRPGIDPVDWHSTTNRTSRPRVDRWSTGWARGGCRIDHRPTGIDPGLTAGRPGRPRANPMLIADRPHRPGIYSGSAAGQPPVDRVDPTRPRAGRAVPVLERRSTGSPLGRPPGARLVSLPPPSHHPCSKCRK